MGNVNKLYLFWFLREFFIVGAVTVPFFMAWGGLAIMQTIYQTSRLRGEDFAQILRHDVEESLHDREKY